MDDGEGETQQRRSGSYMSGLERGQFDGYGGAYSI
jgi:hypothetical protein